MVIFNSKLLVYQRVSSSVYHKATNSSNPWGPTTTLKRRRVSTSRCDRRAGLARTAEGASRELVENSSPKRSGNFNQERQNSMENEWDNWQESLIGELVGSWWRMDGWWLMGMNGICHKNNHTTKAGNLGTSLRNELWNCASPNWLDGSSQSCFFQWKSTG